MVGDGMMTVEKVEVITYRPADAKQRGRGGGGG